jgi:hypothetical protein
MLLSRFKLSGRLFANFKMPVSGMASDLHDLNFLQNAALSNVVASSRLIPSAEYPKKLLQVREKQHEAD